MTALELPALPDVQRYARGALSAASATDTVPVPMDQVAEAANVHPADSLWLLGEDAPPSIRAILAKLPGKVLGAFDLRSRQIYLDMTLIVPRRRFVLGHETGHGVLPWHTRAFMADDDTTLAPTTRELLEAEANAFAAELLFGGDGFSRRADDSAPGLGRPLELAAQYQASAHAALRRYVERTKHEVALLTFGYYPIATADSPLLRVFHGQCVQSASFAQRFGPVDALVPGLMPTDRGDAITLAARATCGVETDTATLRLPDPQRGGHIEFNAEVFANRRLRFVLLYRKTFFSGRRVRVVG